MFVVSIENITTDVHELEKGMDLVRKEYELRSKERHNTVLRDFLNNSEEKLKRLKSEARTAIDSFNECVEFFGENARQSDANTFFSLLVRFAKAFKVSTIARAIIKDGSFLLALCQKLFSYVILLLHSHPIGIATKKQFK